MPRGVYKTIELLLGDPAEREGRLRLLIAAGLDRARRAGNPSGLSGGQWRKLVAPMSDVERVVFLFRHLYGVHHRRIGDLLEVSRGAPNNHLHHCYQLIRRDEALTEMLREACDEGAVVRGHSMNKHSSSDNPASTGGRH